MYNITRATNLNYNECDWAAYTCAVSMHARQPDQVAHMSAILPSVITSFNRRILSHQGLLFEPPGFILGAARVDSLSRQGLLFEPPGFTL
jgi:hypothetical protein